MLKWVVNEITPPVRPGTLLFRANGSRVDFLGDNEQLHRSQCCRAMIETQMIRLRYHANALGLQGRTRIVATGGASTNDTILQIMADVFGLPVYVSLRNTNSAALGGCYRALHTYQRARGVSYSFESATAHLDSEDNREAAPSFRLVASPNMELHESVYLAQYQLYEDLINQVVDGFMGSE
jgi:xylulokinase